MADKKETIEDLIKRLTIPQPGSYEELMYGHEEFREIIRPKITDKQFREEYMNNPHVNMCPRREGMHTIIYEPRQSGRTRVRLLMSVRRRLRERKLL